MIPIFHILNFLPLLLSSLAARKLYYSYRKTRKENVGYFFGLFLSMAIYFCLVSIPGTILNNPFWVQVLYTISWIPLYLAPFFVLVILCNIWHIPRFKLPFLMLAFILITVVIILNIIYFSPTTTVTYNKFYHWIEGTPPWVQGINGSIIGLVTLICSISFFWGGLKTTQKPVRIRSFLLGGGMAILLAASIFNYVISPLFFRGPLTILSSILALTGLTVFFLGIYYKVEE